MSYYSTSIDDVGLRHFDLALSVFESISLGELPSLTGDSCECYGNFHYKRFLHVSVRVSVHVVS